MANILEKAKKEFCLLFLVLTVSLGVSSAMISDSLKSLVFNPLSSSLTCFVKICELLVGVSWLVLLIRIILEAFRIQRKHAPLFLVKKYGTKQFSENEMKRATFGFVRDIIALYRGYYNEIRIISLLAALVGFSMVALTVYTSVYGISSLEESVFHLSVAIFALLVPAIAFIYVNKNWGRKLLKIKKEEKKLEEFLGGTIEI